MVEASAELPLKLPSPEVSPEEVEQLLRVLEEVSSNPPAPEPGERKRPPGWFTAAELAARMGDCATDRSVRKIASAAGPVIVSFPGSPGYKLWSLCSVGEINHCIEAFESQGRDMIKRAVMYRQAYHRRFRSAI